MISIVIVNWNGEDIIGRTVSSVINCRLEYKDLEVIVVDNNSSDGSLNILNKYANNIKIIQSDANLGFAGGCNLGASHAKGRYLLFLNPDTEISHSALIKSKEFMESDQGKDVGILGIQLIDEYGKISRSCARFPKAYMFFFQNIGIDRIWPSLGHTMKEWDHKDSRYVDQVIGAYFFVRSDLFKKLGGFDIDYFVYFEEVDFSLRALGMGFRSYYMANISAIHSGEGTTQKVKAHRLFYSLRSRLIYAEKHFNIIGRIGNNINTLIIEPLSRSMFLGVSGRSDEIKYVWRGYKMLYSDLFKMDGGV